MYEKINNFSEIAKALSVKSKLNSDLLTLFSRFALRWKDHQQAVYGEG